MDFTFVSIICNHTSYCIVAIILSYLITITFDSCTLIIYAGSPSVYQNIKFDTINKLYSTSKYICE